MALCFPTVLWIGGSLMNIGIQDSMSAYCHATLEGHSMRDCFVGFLFSGIAVFAIFRAVKSCELPLSKAERLAAYSAAKAWSAGGRHLPAQPPIRDRHRGA
jgi:hypothetical protein